MKAEELKEPETSLQTLRITRICHINKDIVFNAWTDPNMLEKWWGSFMFKDSDSEFDLRVGGKIRIDVKGFDDAIYPVVGALRQIVPREKLVFDISPLDRNGNEIFRFLVTVTFASVIGETELKVTVRDESGGPEGERYLKNMEEWWIESLGRLRNVFDNMM
ncbi:MAG: SRPBCC family protein [Thermoplasmata archaeon]